MFLLRIFFYNEQIGKNNLLCEKKLIRKIILLRLLSKHVLFQFTVSLKIARFQVRITLYEVHSIVSSTAWYKSALNLKSNYSD